MNLPNKLTVIRMILAPIFMALLCFKFIPFNFFLALIVFIVASLTDMYDGKIARRDNLITDFGKFLDPIADKVLTTAAFLGFIALNIGYGIEWITLIILIREFAVSSVRMIVAAKGTVIAADKWGKIKTVVQMVAIITTLTFEGAREVLYMIAGFVREAWLYDVINIVSIPMIIIYNILLWGSAVLTVISGVNYLLKNKEAIFADM